MIGIGIGAIYYTKDFVNNMQGDIGSSVYPIIISIITIILSVLLLISTYIKNMTEEEKKSNYSKENLIRIGLGIVSFIIYFYLITKLGFIISSTIFILLFLLALGIRDWRKYIFIPVLTPVIIHYIFVIVFKIRLPEILF